MNVLNRYPCTIGFAIVTATLMAGTFILLWFAPAAEDTLRTAGTCWALSLASGGLGCLANFVERRTPWNR